MKSALKIYQKIAQLALAVTLILMANGCDRQEQQKVQILPPVPSPTVSVSPVSPTPQPVTTPTPELVHPQSPVLPQNQPSPVNSSNGSLDGIWKLQYSIHGIVYQSGLEMRGNDGKMLTRFFNVITNQSEMVEQTIELQPSPQGIVLFGSNPVYPGTQTAYPSYSPDNFLFRVNPDGSRIFYTCDDTGNCSPVEIEYLGSN